MKDAREQLDFTGRVAVVLGGGGFLCGAIARELAACGARTLVVSRRLSNAEAVAAEITSEGFQAKPFAVDVLDRQALRDLAAQVQSEFGRVDILINGAGGVRPEATTSDIRKFEDLSENVIKEVFDLNMMGTFMACQAFCPIMVNQGSGTILNISSLGASIPLSRSPAYSAAKAAVTNFTKWLAVHICTEYTPNIRVNALVPGFFIATQNKFLLVEEKTGNLTPRGQKIIEHTPMRRFGNPDDIVLPALSLVSDGFGFVNGTTLVVDGGFSAVGI